VPPFCVLAYGDTEVDPFAVMNERGAPNAWGLPDDMTFTLHGDAHSARQLADDLLDDGFDVAYSYEKRRGSHFPHAIANTQLFLDYDNAGRKFPYKILPITVNCYGQHAIARRAGRLIQLVARVPQRQGLASAPGHGSGPAAVRRVRARRLRRLDRGHRPGDRRRGPARNAQLVLPGRRDA